MYMPRLLISLLTVIHFAVSLLVCLLYNLILKILFELAKVCFSFSVRTHGHFLPVLFPAIGTYKVVGHVNLPDNHKE